MKNVFLLILTGLVLPHAVLAQDVRVHILADSVFVGERFNIAVAVEQASGAFADFPAVPEGSAELEPLIVFGDVEVFGSRRLPPRIEDGVRTDSILYEATTFALDEASFGPLAITIIASEDTTVVASPAATVHVRSALSEGEVALAPPGTPAMFPKPFWVLLVVAVGVVLLILLAGWLWVRNHRSRHQAKPRLAPFPEAIQRLERLTNPTDSEAIKPFYIELADTLRSYLGRTLDVPTLEKTTREVVQELEEDSRVPQPALKQIDGTLRVADLVKFADVHPDDDAHMNVLGKVRGAIEQIETTVHPPEPESPEPQNG